jgi:putative DNA primase/helicase
MTFDILDHLDKLTPAAGKDRYICPVCQGNNLTVSKDGKYQCWSGCECKDIRDAIAPLSIGGTIARAAKQSARRRNQDGIASQSVKAIRPKSDRTWTYTDRDGKELIRTRRIDDGSGKRKIWQEYYVNEQWLSGSKVDDAVKAPLKSAIAPYKYVECQRAIEQGQPIFWAEGEPCADALAQLGLATTTSIGGSASYGKYSDYRNCFGNAQIVIVPDRDTAGIKYAEAVASDYPAAKWLHAYPDSPIWGKLPKDGGLDIADWVDELRTDGLSDEEIRDRLLNAVEDRRESEPEVVGDEDGFEGGKPHFWSTPEKGLVWESFERNPETGEMNRTTTKVGNHLRAIAYVDSPEADNAALLLEFKTFRGAIRRLTLPRSGVVSDPAKFVARLYDLGYSFKRKQKALLLDYLYELGTDVEQTYTVTDKTGWVNGSFVLPHKTYGDQSLRFRDVEPSFDCPIQIKGTLDSWRSEVAAKCDGNSRLIFALGVAFAAPLQPIIGIESGGFHMMGVTSQGKTSALTVAGSVLGVKDLPLWRTTANGLESAATEYNHLCMPIDEIGQAEAKEVGTSAYMLANGQGKSRMKRDLTRSKPKTWQLLFLSSGELSLRDYLKQAGISIKGGQEVRLPDLPAIPQNSQYGVFESIGQYESSAAFVNALEQAVRDHRGSALDAFLERLVSDNQGDGFAKAIGDRTFALAKELTGNYTDTAISRVAKRFALVQVGLNLAHSYGLLPFPIEQCGWAVKTMFDDWVNARGGDGSIEIKQALERIEHLFVSNEYSDRVYNLDAKDEQTVRNLLCYRKKDDFTREFEFWVPNAIFNKECCEGVDRTALIAELQARGWLKPAGADGKPYLGRRIDGKYTRVYVFNRFWNSEKTEVSQVSGVSVSQDIDTARYTDSEDLKPEAGFSRFQRFQQQDSDSSVKPVKPLENASGFSEVSGESIEDKGIQRGETRETSETCKKHESENAYLDDKFLIIVDSLDPTEIGKVYRDD